MLIISIVFMSLAAFTAGEVDPIIQANYETMPTDEFIEYFNSLGHSFTITKYKKDHVISRVVLNPELLKNLTVIEHIEPKDLPDNYDPRKKWPKCATIREVYDQGQCGSSWAFGTATAASDRICILQNKTVRLSEQDYDCFSSNVCKEANIVAAYNFWINAGLVTQECKPYSIEKLEEQKCEETCVNGKDYQADKVKGSSQKRVSYEDGAIKTELFKNGPIQAVFSVYEDFKHYKKGVYSHKYGKLLGGLSVRVLGYGIEKGVKYWLAANNWGKDWGEKGFFKIKRFTDDANFESFLIAPFP